MEKCENAGLSIDGYRYRVNVFMKNFSRNQIFGFIAALFFFYATSVAENNAEAKSDTLIPVATAKMPAPTSKTSTPNTKSSAKTPVNSTPNTISTTDAVPSAASTTTAVDPSSFNYTVTLTRGSLKATIIRLAKQFGWKIVVWHVPNDYTWVGNVTVHGKDLPDIFNQILTNYPVQAVFYQGNHVLLVIPRTLSQ